MAAIRAANTKPELLVRRALHAFGLRYRLHARDLPGKPDLVFPRYKALIFVHGCFWHGHDCHLFTMPATRRDFWEAKISPTSRMITRQEQHSGQRAGALLLSGNVP
jgi:DNA mismatch endonuclease, patch repair protein